MTTTPTPHQEALAAKKQMNRVWRQWDGTTMPDDVRRAVDALEGFVRLDRYWATAMHHSRKVDPNPYRHRHDVRNRRMNAQRMHHTRLMLMQKLLNAGVPDA